MSKVLPIVCAFFAAGALWSQSVLAPVGVTSGQTVRLNVSARPPDSCVAQLGFLDSAGKPIDPSSSVSIKAGESTSLDLSSSAVVTKPGGRAEVQARIVPAPGSAPSACKAEVLAIDSGKKGAEESANEAKPNQAKPAGGTQEGIQVHGHWIIDVRNPDGTLATHREFENSLQTSGATALVNSLARTGVIDAWKVVVRDIGGGTIVALSETQNNLTVSAPTSGPNNGNLVLSGSAVDTLGGDIATRVESSFDFCSPAVLPASCNDTNAIAAPVFTSYSSGNFAIAIAAGQSVQVTVVISFM